MGKLRFSAIYGNGQVMGFSPQEVNAMSMFEYMAAIDGFLKATGQTQNVLSDREKDELWDWLQD